jgi:membrane protein implicated in regulation of membrane protease activity
MNGIYWLIGMLVLLGIEIATMGLTTIWFAGGCLAAFVMAVAGGGFGVQLIVFFVVSLVLLFVTRPIAVKFFNQGRTKTNADSLIGEKAIVMKDIDNLLAEGEVEVNG